MVAAVVLQSRARFCHSVQPGLCHGVPLQSVMACVVSSIPRDRVQPGKGGTARIPGASVLAHPGELSLLKPGCHCDTLFCGTGVESESGFLRPTCLSWCLPLSCASLACSVTRGLVLCVLVSRLTCRECSTSDMTCAGAVRSHRSLHMFICTHRMLPTEFYGLPPSFPPTLVSPALPRHPSAL